jgi:hypothetical protein|nr:MAG TPA: hypothetical protein [Crassvirales sp.]
MLPDITIKGYYLQFIHNAKNDITKYKNNLEVTLSIKEQVYKYIEDNKDILNDSFNINLDDIEIEFCQKKYNPKEYLYNIVIKLLRNIDTHPNRIVLLQLAKYCNILRNENKYNKLIELANKRKDIKFGVYRKYVTAYYNKVHKCVLNGMGYKFSYGIGTYIINHWKLDPKRIKNKVHLDYAATNAKKKELIAKGIKLYDDKEAAWYEARHIPYNAVDYRIYKENTDWYEFTFIKSEIFKSNNLEYQRTEYVATKYRGMSYTQMAEELCHTEEDIYNLQVDIKYKLNILLYKDPTKYLNYVRNAEQCKYKRGTHNS